ncbi:hypothetical protein HPP92_001730 [Vanilla planifolia]|uniref:Uncharacterized protein n=1 Tax=Vanilla planifolia TaxID=51239 RepID=A0A835S323_VANPL|nr:hypothetical protein HPP92_001730 [Vanilla planifolia]
MRRMRWVADGGGWELDAEAPVTMEGTARAVPGDSLPLGLSRGSRLSRSKQLDFLHRFMAFPLVPSFSRDPPNGGLLLHRAHTVHLRENWYVTLLEQFKIQRFVVWLQETASDHVQNTSLPKAIMGKIIDFFSLGFGTELLITPESSLQLEMYNVKESSRAKAVFHQKFHRHNLMLEAACPGLYLDKQGKYWDVPLSIAVDLASITYGSGLDYHVCLQHNSGQPKHIFGDQTFEPPMPLLPGLCAKAAMSIKKHVNFWRGKEGKLKLVQPYDVFLSNPHISGVGILALRTSPQV